jgi:hypothetical protein
MQFPLAYAEREFVAGQMLRKYVSPEAGSIFPRASIVVDPKPVELRYPPGLCEGFADLDFGTLVHQSFPRALTEETGTLIEDWIFRVEPGASGVDATYIGPPHRNPGFTNAELKPASYPAFERFTFQLDSWIESGHVLEGSTELWLYNRGGVIGTSGFRF